MVSALVRDAAAVTPFAVACFVLPYYLLVFCLSFSSLALAWLGLVEWVPRRVGLLLMLLLLVSIVKQPIYCLFIDAAVVRFFRAIRLNGRSLFPLHSNIFESQIVAVYTPKQNENKQTLTILKCALRHRTAKSHRNCSCARQRSHMSDTVAHTRYTYIHTNE